MEEDNRRSGGGRGMDETVDLVEVERRQGGGIGVWKRGWT